MKHSPVMPVFAGVLATAALLGVYFVLVGSISGLTFAQSQFAQFGYFIVSLAVGFGIQAGLYMHLRTIVHGGRAGGMVAATGTTSTAAMVSCCTHYLVNLLPILGASGIAVLAAQYQVKFFWAGIALNILGIVFIARRVGRAHAMMIT